MPDIHPTAIVDRAARLDDDVVIGPYSVVGGSIELGAGTRLVAHVHLTGPMKMGTGNTVHPFACLGDAPQDRKFGVGHDGPGTSIGNDNVFREHVTVNGGTNKRATTIGDRNYFMAGSHVAHDCVVGNDCTFANQTAIAGHCEVGDLVNFGGGAMAQQFCRIGRIAFVGGLLGINRDLPPFCMVHRHKSLSSLNLVGIRRAGLSDSIDALRRAFVLMFRSGLAVPRAVERIRAELGDDAACREFADFAAASPRGILSYTDSRGVRGGRQARVGEA